jgi:DNA-directed RNA polymerase II subunit RPB2
MTIGHLLEMVDAKVAALAGKISVRPPFSTCKSYDNGKDGKDIAEDLGKQLKALGFYGGGNEILFNGQTGRKINARCFIGPCFIQVSSYMYIFFND